jgi:hypothetical protein
LKGFWVSGCFHKLYPLVYFVEGGSKGGWWITKHSLDISILQLWRA